MTRQLSSQHFMQTFSTKLETALNNLSLAQYPPDAARSMRKFSSTEVAALLGVTEAYIRQVSFERAGPGPRNDPQRRRLYSLDQVLELRMHLAEKGRKKWINPRRVSGEECQIIAVTNFKGGSTKTATTIHLGHWLALRGYRVLAVDMDPQGSLTSLHGALPGFDYREGDTLFAAIKFDFPVSTPSIVHKTHITGFDVICAGLELTEFETAVALEMRKTGGTGFLLRVSQALEQVADDYDVILLDCAPFAQLSDPVVANRRDRRPHSGAGSHARCRQHRQVSRTRRLLYADPGCGRFGRELGFRKVPDHEIRTQRPPASQYACADATSLWRRLAAEFRYQIDSRRGRA